MRSPARAEERLDRFLSVRADAAEALFEPQAERIAELCHGMATRFARGGRLLACGGSAGERSDARHVAVEFVHPVIVGKRALPALAVEPWAVGLLAEPDDIVVVFGRDAAARAAVSAAQRLGCETLAFAPVGARWELGAPTPDPSAAQELAETLYHVLWELVHVFFEHRGLLAGRAARPLHDPGAASFLYPFLGERETDLDAVLADVAASVRAKAREAHALRERTLHENADVLHAAARALRACFDGGGRLLALGNGGSATDAMDLVADLREPRPGAPWPARAALDLTEDPSILTALANDIGVEAVFARQVIAHGRPGDALVAFSTSGGSANVLSALAQARQAGMVSVALVGYDGGRILDEALADHVVVTRSEHIPRIQEAQATAYHLLRELLEAPRR